MPSIKGVTLERIESEYRRPKTIPTTMSQVADMVGLDYVEMMEFIRDSAPDFDFHIITKDTCKRVEMPLEKRADYMLDYYLGAESSMVSLAILFDYSTNKAVRRVLTNSKVYQERVKGQRTRSARERMTEVIVKAPAATAGIDLSTQDLNRVILQFVEARLPVFSEWGKVKERHFNLYPPIYKKAMNMALERNVSLDDLIASAILKIHIGAKK
jgi:hypothetical protein